MAVHAESLTQKHCVPCHGGGQAIRREGLAAMARQVPLWELVGDSRIVREFTFADFRQTLAFVNRVAALADAENHHPTVTFTYGKCRLELWTHTARGLTENDFILAAKIDQMSHIAT